MYKREKFRIVTNGKYFCVQKQRGGFYLLNGGNLMNLTHYLLIFVMLSRWLIIVRMLIVV